MSRQNSGKVTDIYHFVVVCSSFPNTLLCTFLQPWTSSLVPNAQGPTVAQAPPAVPKPVVEVTSGVLTQPSSVEVKPSGRKELPEVMGFFFGFSLLISCVHVVSYL